MVFFLFGVLHRFQHCTGHITTGSWKGRGSQCIQFIRFLEAMAGAEPWPQRWEARVLPICHLWCFDILSKIEGIGEML